MWAKLLIPALTCLSFARGQSECTTPDGQIGVCKRIDTCEPLYKLIHEAVVVHEENMNHLRKSGCGFDQNTGIPMVCCPSCLTHEIKSVPGKCTDILECEHIRKELTTPPVSQQFKVYVNSLRCQGKANFNVCCDPPASEFVARIAPTQAPTTEHVAPTTVGPQTAYERASIPGLQQGQAMPGNGNTDTCAMGAQPPDPAGNCCGHCGSSTRIHGGNETNIDEYPWLALIEYQKEDKIKLLCGGALISGRYVLTAGHCVVGLVLSAGTPKNVRLGEYDTANEGKDCVELDGGEEGEEDCTLEPVIIPIEQIIPHPDYNPRHLLRRNDIALLRLASIPEYTPFVRPICLPTTDITANSLQPKSLFVAGWGAVSDRISFSQVKLHVMLPLKTLEVCQQSYRSPGRRINLWDHQVCAGGELGKDSCKGDSGGPLMYNNGNHYELTGIVSFGPIPCGLEDVPGVYTKVFEYLTWIRNNIKP